MSSIHPLSNTPKSELEAVELCLRLGDAIFGVSFTDLTDAREAARQINLTGRDVEIYEKTSGKVLESSKGMGNNALTRSAPRLSVVISASKQNPQSLPASE